MVVAPAGVFRVGLGLLKARYHDVELRVERGIMSRNGGQVRYEGEDGGQVLGEIVLVGQHDFEWGVLSAKASKPRSGPRMSEAMTNASELFATASVFIPSLTVAMQPEKQVIGLTESSLVTPVTISPGWKFSLLLSNTDPTNP